MTLHSYAKGGALLMTLLCYQWAGAPFAQATVFNTTRFVQPGAFAVGVEPVLTLSQNSGISGNFKYTHGLSDLTNLMIGTGLGMGPERFRLGAGLIWDFFPDTEEQPGMGIATQMFYYKLASDWQMRNHIIPYIHKGFGRATTGSGEPERKGVLKGAAFDPFLAAPVGIGWNFDQIKPQIQAVIGSNFHAGEGLLFIAEFGLAILNSTTYFSGGLAYYY